MNKKTIVCIDQQCVIEYGLYAALILDAVRNRIELHLKEPNHRRVEAYFKLHHGRAWINASASFIANHLYMERSTVTKNLSKLVDAGVLIADDFDNTQIGLWYAFSPAFIRARSDFFHAEVPPKGKELIADEADPGGDLITPKQEGGCDEITSRCDEITSKGCDEITPSLYIDKNITYSTEGVRAQKDESTEKGTTELTSASTPSPKRKTQPAGRQPAARTRVPVRDAPPTLDEVLAYAAQIGFGEAGARMFFKYFTTPGDEWVDSKGQVVYSWKKKMLTWKSRDDSDSRNAEPNTTGVHWSRNPDLSTF